MMIKQIKRNILLVIKGGAIGVANIIPGVSGGTLAVVMGVYDYLIEAIANFFNRPAKRKEYLLFLIKIFSGALAAIVLLASLMEYLLTSHYNVVMFLFMGLILGGIPAVVKSHGDMKISISRLCFFMIGFFLVIIFSFLGNDSNGANMSTDAAQGTLAVNDYLLLASGGFFAGGAMIVPGISGSFILVLLGQYYTVIHAVKTFDLKALGVIAIAVVFGILVFSRIINVCLKKFPAKTYYFILGLIIASLYKIFPGIAPGTLVLTGCFVSFLAGLAVSFILQEMS